MKEIKSYKMGDHIPSNAKFICTGSEDRQVSERVPGTRSAVTTKTITTRVFLYEVPVMTEKKNNTDNHVVATTKEVIEYLNMKTGKNFSIEI